MPETQVMLAFGTITRVFPHIMELKVKDGVDFDVDCALKTREVCVKLNDGVPYGVLMNAQNHFNPTAEARELIADKDFAVNRIATAMVINSLPQKILGNFYLNFNQPPEPTKIFNNREKALEWLQEKVEESEKLKKHLMKLEES